MTAGHVTQRSWCVHTVHSLAGNNICFQGNMAGLDALIGAFKQTPQLASLKCVSSRTPTARFAMMCDSGLCHSTAHEVADLPFRACCSLDRNLIKPKGAVALAKGLPKLLVSLR